MSLSVTSSNQRDCSSVCFVLPFSYQVFARDGEKLKKLVFIYLLVLTKPNHSQLTATLKAVVDWLNVLTGRQKAKGIQQRRPCGDSERSFS